MPLDLRDAMRVISEGRHPDLKVGIVKKDIPGMCSDHKKGRVVLFKLDRDGKTLTVETPMSAEWIDREKARGSGLRTVGTMVGVPKDYIEEVVV